MTDLSTSFDPVACYEELRTNVLAEPGYASQSSHLFQRKGMGCWLTQLDTMNLCLASAAVADGIGADLFKVNNSGQFSSPTGLHSRLSPILAEIILTIYPEVYGA